MQTLSSQNLRVEAAAEATSAERIATDLIMLADGVRVLATSAYLYIPRV